MRVWIISLSLSVATAAAAAKPPDRSPSKAEEEQEAQEQDSSEDASEEMQTSEVSEKPVQGEKPAQGGVRTSSEATAPAEVHSVIKGDTLWDLSQHYLGNPWYWPKVWSYNPEISNPHWIYPGNQVRFFPGGEEAPTQVETGKPEETPEVAEAQQVEATMDQVTPEITEAAPVQVTGKIGYTPKPTTSVVHTGFVTPRELEEAGSIDASFSEALMLSAPDTIYVRFKKNQQPRLQERYIIFHT